MPQITEGRITHAALLVTGALVVVLLTFSALRLSDDLRNGDAGPSRVDEPHRRVLVLLRGIKKSGTTWLEVVLLESLWCFAQLDGDDGPGTDALAGFDYGEYRDRSASFFVSDQDGVAAEYRLLVPGKHLFGSWQYGERRGQSLRRRMAAVGVDDDEAGGSFFDDPSVREFDVVIYRDPRDTTLSKAQWHDTPLDAAFFDEATATMRFYLERSGLQPRPHAYFGPLAPESFFWSYELSQLGQLGQHLEALWEALNLPRRHRHACRQHVVERTSIEATRELESRMLLPGADEHPNKVQQGQVCHFSTSPTFASVAHEPRWSLKDRLPDAWYRFFADPNDPLACRFPTHKKQ